MFNFRTCFRSLATVSLILSISAVLFSTYYSLRLTQVIARRAFVPLAIEINESICLDLALRSAQNQPLYVKPSVNFISECYPPFYFHVASLLLKVTGVSLPALRSISILSLAFLVIVTIGGLKKTKCSTLGSVVSIGLFIAAYEKTGYWYDLARIDMLCLLLLAVAFWISFVGNRSSAALAGVALFSLSILTKQTSLFFLPAMAFLIGQRFGLNWAAVCLSVPPICLFLHLTCVDWMWFFLILVPRHQSLLADQVSQFLERPFPLFLATFVIAVVTRTNFITPPTEDGLENLKSTTHTSRSSIWNNFAKAPAVAHPLHYLVFYACATFSGLIGSLKAGGSINHFIPMIYFNAIIVGIAWSKVSRQSTSTKAVLLVKGIAVVQLCLNFYTGSFAIHQAKAAEADFVLLEHLKRLKHSQKPIYCHQMRANHVAKLAGFETMFNYQALISLQLANERAWVDMITQQVHEQVKECKFSYIIVREIDLEESLFKDQNTYVKTGEAFESSFGRIVILESILDKGTL